MRGWTTWRCHVLRADWGRSKGPYHPQVLQQGQDQKAPSLVLMLKTLLVEYRVSEAGLGWETADQGLPMLEALAVPVAALR
jgi:hypothetical protein